MSVFPNTCSNRTHSIFSQQAIASFSLVCGSPNEVGPDPSLDDYFDVVHADLNCVGCQKVSFSSSPLKLRTITFYK